MKGIVLAGGKATRLRPLTKITSLNNIYLQNGELAVNIIDGVWEDAGT